MSKYQYANWYLTYTAIAAAVVGIFCLYARLYGYGALCIAGSAALIVLDRWLKKRGL